MDSVEELKQEVFRLKAGLMEIVNPRPEYFKGKGCSDGNCVIYRPVGMHTNGGCKCDRDRPMWMRIRLAKLMQDAKDLIDGKKPA